jgi:hypothetical protein
VTKLIFSDILGSAWKGIKEDLALVGGLTLVYFVGLAVAGQVPLIGVLFSMPLTAGYFRCLLKIRHREVIGFEDFLWGFWNFNRFLHLILLYAFVWLGGLVGFVLLVIPGIWWFVVTSFSSQIIVLKHVDSVEAIKKSMALVEGRWWNIFGFGFKIFLVNLAGLLCFFIGLLVAFPVTAMAGLIAAEKLLAELPPSSPPQGLPPISEGATTAVTHETQTP